MKIAFLTLEYPSSKTASSGGIGTSIYNLSKGLIALGHNVSVLVSGQDCDETFNDNGVTIHKIENVTVKGFSFYFTQKKLQKIINNLVLKGEIDIVEAPDWTGITAFLNLKCPYVIRLNGSDTYFCHLEKRKVKYINCFFEKRGLRRANGLISVSKYTADVTNEIFNLNRELTIIPNSINYTSFESSINTKPNIILYFGTLIRKKGLIELPSIFNLVYNQNNDAKLILVGKDAGDIITGGNSTWEIMKPLFSAAAFKNVSYLGAVPYNEIKSQIECATICVFPTFAEALPVSWLEAMAMKKPIVATNIGWASEVIEDEKEGFLVHPTNHQKFADKIINLLENKGLQVEFGSNALKKIINKFSIEVVAKQSIEFYKQILKN